MITVRVVHIKWKNRKLPVEVDGLNLNCDYREKDLDDPQKEREVIKLIDEYFDQKYAETPTDYDWDFIGNVYDSQELRKSNCKCDRCGRITKYEDMFITSDQDVPNRILVVCKECSKNYLNPISIKDSMKKLIEIVNKKFESSKNIRRFKIKNIKWDQDEDDDTELPEEFIIDVAFPNTEDIISDAISDKYGYCHNGFDFDEIPISDEEDVLND